MEITKIRSTIIDCVEKITQDWDLELDDEITVDNKLVADLDFASVDFIQLIVAIEEQLDRKLGFHDLLMSDGQYVEDLTIAETIDFVDKKVNQTSAIEPQNNKPELTSISTKEKIDAAKLKEFRNNIPAVPSHKKSNTPKNKPAVFVLSSPRSGSTLLRVILAGHPQLFAPPELHLLNYKDLQQRKAALSNELNDHLLEGTIRSIVQLKNCNVEAAERVMKECEAKNSSVKEFYNLLQTGANDRILVDKTPAYTFHLDILKRAEIDFADPLYIHLVRHPYGMIRSFEDAKLDKLVPFMRNSSFSRREVGELLWLYTQQNILEFLQEIPQNRHLLVRFEDLVTSPQTTVEKICQFLNIEFSPEMLDPYEEKERRMTDGVRVASRFSGDLKFHLHQKIEPSAAYRWKQFLDRDFLGDITWKVAKLFGYEEND